MSMTRQGVTKENIEGSLESIHLYVGQEFKIYGFGQLKSSHEQAYTIIVTACPSLEKHNKHGILSSVIKRKLFFGVVSGQSEYGKDKRCNFEDV